MTSTRHPGDYSVEFVPPGLTLVREYDTPEPDGATAYLRWFAPDGSTSPVLTVNVMVGTDAKARLDQLPAYAAELADAAQRESVELPPFERTTVRGAEALAYSDPIGWRSLSWSPRGDILVAVNGLRFSTDELLQVAEQVQIP